MKKILSLVCAVALALGVSAQPIALEKAVKFEKIIEKTDLKKAPAAAEAATTVKIGTVKSQYYDASVVGTPLVMYSLYSEDGKMLFSFPIYLEGEAQDVELGKTYTLDGMLASYAYVQTSANKKTFSAATFTKTLTADGRVKIDATAKASTTDYTITYEEPKIVAPTGETINVVITEPFSKEYYTSSKDWYITASNDDYKVVIDVMSTNAESPVGTYKSDEDGFDLTYTYLNDLKASTKINAQKAEATIVLDGKVLKLTAAILGYDGIVYAVTASLDESILKYDATSANYAEDFATYNVDDENFENGGELDVYASNSNNGYVALAFFSATEALAAGEYTISDTKAAGTVLASVGVSGSSVTKSFAGYTSAEGYISTPLWFLVAGKVTVDADGNIDINATNSAGCTIKCKLTAPKAGALQYDEVEADFAEDFATYNLDAEDFEETGELDVYASNANNGYLSLAFFTTTPTLATGEYSITDTKAAGTVLASVGVSEGYLTASFAGYTSTSGGIANVWFLVAGKVTVDADGNITIDATNSVGRTIKCKLTAPKSGVLQYDEVETDFAENFASYTLSDEDFDTNGILEVEASNANNGYIDLAFFSASKTLAAGEYNITDTEAAGTVLASVGVEGGYVKSSFAGYVGSSGLSNVWFLVAGKVVVDEKGNIEVDATNSADRTIKCKLSKDIGTAIDNINAAVKATKTIENGMLIIEMNGVRYNVLGNVIR